MNLLSQTYTLAFLVLYSLSSIGQENDFDPNSLISGLNLRSAPTAMSSTAGWAPEKILVLQLPGYPELAELYASTLRKYAANVELTILSFAQFSSKHAELSDADAIIGFCTKELLQNASSKLRWIHNYSVGMDRCNGATDEQLKQITFTNNKRLSAPAIAEHSLAMLLSLTRNLPTYAKAQSAARWHRLSNSVRFGELKGKTLLVVGLGGIGTEIARRAHGLGMRIIATRNSSREGPEFVDYVGLADELHRLAGQADVIANALPLTKGTRGIFDKAFFAASKRGAIFLSVGRGKSTVTGDLVAALESGHLYGAGLDVTDPEPLPPDNPLWHMDNVIITPHVAAAGIDSRRRSLIIAAENVRRYVAGEALLNVVDMTKGY